MNKFLEWEIPIFTLSEANNSEHWSRKKKRHDMQKKWIKLWWMKEKPIIHLPCHIKLTRIGKRLLDSDNLPVSMKYIRDSIADLIFPGLAPGQADNDTRLSWSYDQKTGKFPSVKIEFFKS